MKFTSFHVMLCYLAGEILAFTFFLPFFFSNGASKLSILVYFFVAYVTGVCAIALNHKINPKQSIILGLLIRAAFVVMIFLFGSNSSLPWLGLMAGPLFLLLWVPFNYSYFLSVKDKHASGSWKYSFASPVLSVVMPIAGGLISTYFHQKYLFLFAIPFYILGVYITTKVEWVSIEYNLKDSLKKYSRLRTLTLLEGFWQPIFFIGIPFITYSYIQNSLKFGSFYSYLGILSAVAAFIMASYSDKKKKRKIFIYGISFSLALTSFGIAFHKGALQWEILASLIYLLHPMAITFILAMVLDLKDSIPDCMIAREYLLNFGRALGTLLMMFFLIYGNMLHGLIVLSIAILIYPFLVKVKKLYAVEGVNVQD